VDAARDPLRSRERNPRESLWDLGQSILHELPSLIGDRVELLSLELQRASQALVKITVLATGAAILALTAWLALWGVLAGVLIALDWPPAAACAIVVVINAAAAAWLVLRARSLLKLIGLPATRRHLLFGRREPPVTPPDERHVVAPGSLAS
jgi:uncharacterized membrane protein YqjE